MRREPRCGLGIPFGNQRRDVGFAWPLSVMRDIPIVVVDGSPDVVEKTIAGVKSCVATSSFELASVLDTLEPDEG